MAAAGDDKKSDYKDPDPVIVEERAKAVVHKKPPLKNRYIDLRIAVLTIILCRTMKLVRKNCRFL